MEKKLKEILAENNIDFSSHTHTAAFTCEDLKNFEEEIPGEDCKNLFLTDHKRKNFFIFSTLAGEKVNLKELALKMNVKKLSFGKPEKLLELLNLEPGSVNPFAVLFDETKSVKLFLDEALMNCEKVGFHPMINTETLVMSPSDLKKLFENTEANFEVV